MAARRAVAAGTVMAAEVSRRLVAFQRDVARVRRILARAGLPVQGAPLPAARYLDLMGHDQEGGGRQAAPGAVWQQLGRAGDLGDCAQAEIIGAIEACCAEPVPYAVNEHNPAAVA